MKKLLAIPVSIVALLLIYQYISIPVISCFTVYLCAMLAMPDKKSTFQSVFYVVSIVLVTGVGIFLYGFQVYMEIVHYPKYGNFLTVGTDILNVFSFVGAFFMFLPYYKNKNY